MSATGALAGVLVLLPALLRWVWARGITRDLNDPALPERLFANQRRNQIVLILSVGLLLYFHPIDPFLGIPALLIARASVGYPFRKRLYGETWNLFTYLGFFTRLLMGVYGVWLLFLWVPTVTGWFGRFDWVAGLALAALMFVWCDRSTEFLRWILNAKPITDAALVERFVPMARQTCGEPLARFEYVDMQGGAVANAIALPSWRGSGTLFSSTLLALLDRDEIIAIAAHELAHLEYYNARWLRKARMINLGLIALAAATTPVFRIFAPSAQAYAQFPLLILFMGTMLWRARDRQKNETVSDLRAVELCGDADALARGLTKLYAFARIPRRWDAQRERQATHPSLARRIRDIRAASGAAPAAIAAATTIAGSDGRSRVTFTDTRVEWVESEDVMHSLGYAHLSELRVHANPSGPARLIAVEKTGRRWEMPLGAADVAPVQSVLDTVDGRLASVTPPRLPPGIGAVIKYFCVTTLFVFGQITCALIALLAALRPTSNLLMAAGVATLAAAALGVRDWLSFNNPYGILGLWLSVILAAVGGGILLMERTTRRDETGPAPLRLVWILAGVAALMLTLLGLNGVDALRLHQASSELPAVTIVLAAVGGAFLSDRRRNVRLAGVAPAVLALGVGAAGSLPFLDYVARDPFLIAAGPATVHLVEAEPTAEMQVPFTVAEMRLSPSGRAIAVQEDDDDRDSVDSSDLTVQVGRVGAELQKVTADQVVFIDDNRALALRFAEGTADLRAFAIANPDVATWHARVNDVTSGSLLVSRDGLDWRLIAWSRARAIVSAHGRIGDAGVARVEWPAPPGGYAWERTLSAEGSDALFMDTQYQMPSLRNPLLIGLYTAMRSHTESHLWHIVNGERRVTAVSRLDVNCNPDAVTGLVCEAFDGARTRIVAVDTATATVKGIGTLWGRFRSRGPGGPGWVAGWLDSSPVAIRLATNEALKVPNRPREWINAVAASDGAIAAASRDGRHGSTVRVYPLTYRSARR